MVLINAYTPSSQTRIVFGTATSELSVEAVNHNLRRAEQFGKKLGLERDWG
jgi:hypothetical protein